MICFICSELRFFKLFKQPLWLFVPATAVAMATEVAGWLNATQMACPQLDAKWTTRASDKQKCVAKLRTSTIVQWVCVAKLIRVVGTSRLRCIMLHMRVDICVGTPSTQILTYKSADWTKVCGTIATGLVESQWAKYTQKYASLRPH